MIYDYVSILLALIVSLTLGSLIFGLSFFLSYYQPDFEKESAYECGFNPFDDARLPFDVRFYLVAILFIIFDLEISFLFPWSIGLSSIHEFGYWIGIFFIYILTLGFIYEWKKGALEWD